MVRERADRNGGSAPVTTSTGVNVAELRQLITLMDQSDIEELTIERADDGLHLTLRKPAPVALDPALLLADEVLEIAASASPDAAPDAETGDDAAGALAIRSTLVGFYRAVARRGAKPLASGDSVKEGQIIGAVEALNVLNEVESPAAGRIRKILVSDGQPVQYGQVLMMVDPLEA